MLKKTAVYLFLLILCFSCVDDKQKQYQEDGFVLTVSIENADGNTSYLHKLSTTPVTIIDSAIVTNNKITFIGKIDFPERYLLTINTVFGGKLIILENDSINVIATDTNLIDAKTSGSKLNDELALVLKNSVKIYDQIDLLFPDMQRARLGNNALELKRISNKMQAIEQENIDYNFDYAKQNNDSFISVMILNDLSKRDSIDVNRLTEVYNSLSSIVKESSDGKEVASFLASQH